MQYQMRGWARKVIFGLVLTNVALVASGTYFLVHGILRFREMGSPDTPPYYLPVFYAENALNLAFLLALLVGSVLLWRRRRAGRWTCNIVFVLEIAYLLGGSAFQLVAAFHGGSASLIGSAMGATGGTGNMGIALQLISGYPIIALILLNLTFAKGKESQAGSCASPRLA